MKILIAGGTGLIGTALSDSLFRSGHTVGFITRNPAKVSSRFNPVPWDDRVLRRELATTQAVINLAGESLAGKNPLRMRWTPKRKELILSSRLDAGRRLSNAISQLENKPEVFLQASAIGFYGSAGTGPIEENSPAGDDFLADVCQRWEESTVGLQKQGVRRLVIRIGLVLSPSGGMLPTLALPFHLFAGGRMGDGNQTLSWIHIADLVKSIEHLIFHSENQGVFNLTAPIPERNITFAKILGDVLGKPAWLPIPAPVLRLILGEAATLALDGQPVYPARLLNAGYTFNYPDLESALQDLFLE